MSRLALRRMPRGKSARIVRLLGLLLVAVFGGCSGDDGGGADPKPGVLGGDGDYGVRVFIDSDGGPKEVRFGPAPNLDGPIAPSGELQTDSLRTRAFDDVSDPKVNQWTTAWAVAFRAGAECGYSQLPAATLRFFFMTKPGNCAVSVREQEGLLCIADKLAEVADAVGPVVWPSRNSKASDITLGDTDMAALGGMSGRDQFMGRWVIPPQSDKDRFVVRDLAVHVLSYIPVLASMPMAPFAMGSASTSSEGGRACTAIFADAAAGKFNYTTNSDPYRTLFGLDASQALTLRPVFVPMTDPLLEVTGSGSSLKVTKDRTPEAARIFLNMEAQVLRASGNLLRDLVRRSVYSDLAGAESRRAAAMDALRGNRIAWGDEGVYNSYAHAMRVIAGRWEMTSESPDPKCADVKALELLTQGYGPDRDTRVEDREIATVAQATAALLVEKAGIVLPDSAFSIAGALRPALFAQLQLGLVNSGIAAATATEIANRELQGLSDDDLVFAFRRVQYTYRFTASVGALASAVVIAQPFVRGPTAPAVAGLGGAVVIGGLPRGRMVSDPMARAGRMLVASECGADDPGVWSAWTSWKAGARNPWSPTGSSTPPYAPRMAVQDAFQVGQALGRELARLDSLVTATNTAPDAEAVARGGLGELKGWAGTGLVVVTGDTRAMGDAPNITLSFSGFDTPDVATVQRFMDDTVLVFGPPWAAECAIGLRTDGCTTVDRQNNTVATYTSSRAIAVSPPGDSSFGGIRDLFTATWSVPDSLPSGYLIYVVRKSSMRGTTGLGAVLGALQLPPPNTEMHPPLTKTGTLGRGFAVSPMRDELLKMVLGVGKWVGERPPRIGDASNALSAGYCVDGIPRDLFVPLENELTGDSDQYENSWRHYLNLAHTAADRADQLGNELLQLQLKRDERREAAGEVLGDICGDLGAVDDVVSDKKGNVTAKPGDDTLAVCLNEPTTDVVFFSSLPRALANASVADGTQWIKDKLLQCTGLGKSNELCKKTALTWDSLGIVTDPPPTATTTNCDGIVNTSRSLRAGLDFNGMATSLADDFTSDVGVRTATARVRMEVQATGTWLVRFGDQIIMSSAAGASQWPGCLRSGGSCYQGPGRPQGDARAKQLNALFRWNGNGDASLIDQVALGGWGGTASANEEEFEIHALRWRVQGAMYLLGAFAGEVPEGMFTLPVPVVSLTDNPNAPNEITVAGAFLGDPQRGYRLDATTESLDDVRLFGVASLKDARLAIVGPYGTGELPRYYIDSMTDATHVLPNVRSRAVSFPPGRLGVSVDAAHISEGRSRDFAYALISHKNLAGGVCRSAMGAIDPPTSNDPRGPQYLVDVAKGTLQTGGYLGSSMCTSAVESGWGHNNTCRFDTNVCGDFCRDPRTDSQATSIDLPFAHVTYGSRANALHLHGFAPDARALSFVNAVSPAGACGSLTEAFAAYGLSCLANADPQGQLLATPTIDSVYDLPRLREWLGVVSSAAYVQAASLYIEKVPQRVVADFRAKQVGIGSKKGTRGESLLRLEAALEQLPAHLQTIGGSLQAIRGLIKNAEIRLLQADLNANTKLQQLALEQLKLQRAGVEMLTGALQGAIKQVVAGAATGDDESALMAVSALAGANPFAAGTQALVKEQETVEALKKEVGDDKANAIADALNQLELGVTPHWQAITKALGDLRTSAADAMIAAEALDVSASKAQYEAAKATGADQVLDASGKAIALPVNTVLRRQAEGTDIRYRRALADAKGLAFMARRAIEQRIGVPLTAITTRVGPLDPPAGWADDVCRLSGINYDHLRTIAGRPLAATGDAGDAAVTSNGPIGKAFAVDIGPMLDAAAVLEYADSYVGDYVVKLEQFVEQYNTAFPSHEADDTAVVSLREDLLPRAVSCVGDSRNLLLHSGELDVLSPSAADPALGGWRVGPCTGVATTCLSALGGATLGAPQDGPAGPLATPSQPNPAPRPVGYGVSWLFDHAATNSPIGVSGDAGTGGVSSQLPAGVVAQPVSLDAGHYVLSYWDAARAADGAFQTSRAVPYGVFLWDATLTPLLAKTVTPSLATAASPWSDRRSFAFDIASGGIYWIGFSASRLGAGDLGSVAIAQVQLEKAPPGGQPTSYVVTGDTHTTFTAGCPVDPDGLRALFVRRCEANACFYELSRPLYINTESLRDGESPLGGKLARGNFNFRHIGVAANFVGRALLDCSDTPTTSCYGSGYLEYDLVHNARSAGILDWHGDQRLFDFGIASIRHGKGLAMDRVLSFPLTQTDSALLQQTGIEKPEFRGRPLDGTYSLRIYETPALRWERLEDVQFVLRHRYWSRINGSTTGN